MTIPSTIKVGGHHITVDAFAKLEGDLEGEFDSGTNTIRLADNLAPSQRESIFFHELLHSLNRTLDSEVVGHQFLASLAEQLYQVLSDNDMLK